MLFKLTVLLAAFGLSACITTRASMKEEEAKKEIVESVEVLRKGKADLEAQMSEINSEFRNVNGRIEVIENDLGLLKTHSAEKNSSGEEQYKALSEKVEIVVQAVGKLEAQLSQLGQDIAILKQDVTSLKKRPIAVKKKVTKKKGNYTQAEEDFAANRWREAAINYEEYRKLNPTGRRYERATYRMGVCFQEMNMLNEAKAFYEEVISRNPGGKYAGQATEKLKKIK